MPWFLRCAALAGGALLIVSCQHPPAEQAPPAAPPAQAAPEAPAAAPGDQSMAAMSGDHPTAAGQAMTAGRTNGAAMNMDMSEDADGRDNIPAGDPVPTISLALQGHEHGVWSFDITTDFMLTNAMGPYTPMHGHIHVYVDGTERMMIYQKHFTLKDLAPGTHTVRVALAATTHRALYHDGAPIADSVSITVP